MKNKLIYKSWWTEYLAFTWFSSVQCSIMIVAIASASFLSLKMRKWLHIVSIHTDFVLQANGTWAHIILYHDNL